MGNKAKAPWWLAVLLLSPAVLGADTPAGGNAGPRLAPPDRWVPREPSTALRATIEDFLEAAGLPVSRPVPILYAGLDPHQALPQWRTPMGTFTVDTNRLSFVAPFGDDPHCERPPDLAAYARKLAQTLPPSGSDRWVLIDRRLQSSIGETRHWWTPSASGGAFEIRMAVPRDGCVRVFSRTPSRQPGKCTGACRKTWNELTETPAVSASAALAKTERFNTDQYHVHGPRLRLRFEAGLPQRYWTFSATWGGDLAAAPPIEVHAETGRVIDLRKERK